MTLDRSQAFYIFKVIVIIYVITILIDYYNPVSKVPRVTMVYEKSPKFQLRRPTDSFKTLNHTSYYNKLVDINFNFTTIPQPCRGYEAGLLLLIMVSSNPTRFEHRSAIRNTWGRTFHSTKVVFLIGEPAVEISEKVRNESLTFGDIVQGNFKDVYRNLTYKHVMGLKWVSHHCPSAKYVLKTDDDVLVNPPELKRFLARELSPWGATGLIMCRLAYYPPVYRDPKSKWYVSLEEFTGKYYPSHCIGPIIIYSQDVVQVLYSTAQRTPYFWVDDVYVTGIVAERAGVKQSQYNVFMKRKDEVKLLTKGPKAIGKFMFGPIDMKVKTMIDMWVAMSKASGKEKRKKEY